MNRLERAAVRLLLAGDHPTLAALRAQRAAARVGPREPSGAGFFTHLAVPASAPRVAPAAFVLGDVGADVDGVEHGVGLLLFVRDGALSLLEGFTHGAEPWPDPPRVRRLYYLRAASVARSPAGGEVRHLVPADRRDLDALRRVLAPDGGP